MDFLVERKRKFNELAFVMIDYVLFFIILFRFLFFVVFEALMGLIICFEVGIEFSVSVGRWEGFRGCLCWKGSIWRRS